jgi:hypothetical protein
MIDRNNFRMNFRLFRLSGYAMILFGSIFAIVGIYEFQRTMIMIEWSTASELDTAGFNIYRTDLSSNDKIKVNPVLIPGSSDPFSGGDYQFEDENVDPGKTYLYSLEEIEMSGGKNNLGEIEVKAEYRGLPVGLLSFVFIFLGGLILFLHRFTGR